jgi:hypothetical protein
MVNAGGGHVGKALGGLTNLLDAGHLHGERVETLPPLGARNRREFGKITTNGPLKSFPHIPVGMPGLRPPAGLSLLILNSQLGVEDGSKLRRGPLRPAVGRPSSSVERGAGPLAESRVASRKRGRLKPADDNSNIPYGG